MSKVGSLLNNLRFYNFILFTQPSAMSVTAAKWIDSWARLQFRFFLNLFSCLLTTNLSRRNNRSRAGLQTLFNFRRNGNRQWILITFHVYSCCYQRCSLDRNRMQMTHFSFDNQDATKISVRTPPAPTRQVVSGKANERFVNMPSAKK